MNQDSNHESVNESMLSEPLLPSSSSSSMNDPEVPQAPVTNNNNEEEVNDSDGNPSSHCSNFESVNESSSSMLSEPLLPTSPSPRNDDPEQGNEINEQDPHTQNDSSSNGSNESNPSSSSSHNHKHNHNDEEEEDEEETNTNILETIHQTRHLLHHIPHFKKLFGAFTLLLAGLVATEETIDEWSRHHHPNNNHNHNSPPDKTSTRLEQVTYCAQQISSSVGVPTLPFNGGSSPQLRAIDWFVEGGGRSTVVDTARCTQGEFRDLYALQVLGSSLLPPNDDGGGIWDRYPASNLRDVCRSWPRITCDDHNTIITRLHLGNGGYTGTLPSELAVLSSLERFEAYHNPKLSGTLPSIVVSHWNQLRVLYLHQTSLGGTIPKELGSLRMLEELLLEETDVRGVVPPSVCSLREKGSLRELEMDCKGVEPWVECGCCSKCFTHKGGGFGG